SITREAFTRAGLSSGMRLLDIGCGVGEVARIASDVVGNGRVVALDVDAKAVEFARGRLSGRNIEFIQSTVEDYKSGEPFDAAVGRFILMHLKDPLMALRHVSSQVRPGGILCFIEAWNGIATS